MSGARAPPFTPDPPPPGGLDGAGGPAPARDPAGPPLR